MADESNKDKKDAESASDLASKLLKDRFDGDEINTARYLLQAIESLPNAEATKRIVLGVRKTPEAPDNAVNADIGEIMVEKVTVSCTQPRVKLDMKVGAAGLLFSKDETPLFVVTGDVSHCIFFPKPSDCKKTVKKVPPDMVLLVLTEAIVFKKKDYSQICFQLPANDTTTTETWNRHFQSVLNVAATERVLIRNNPVFKSYQNDKVSSTTAGLPFVDCYFNVNGGCLYFLNSGIFFFGSGMHFWPRSALLAIEPRPVPGRFLTISVTLEDDDVPLEFSGISKDEHSVIERYIRQTLIPAMEGDVAEEGTKKRRESNDDSNENGSGEEAAEDEEGGMSAEEEGVNPKSKPTKRKRKAASEAREINKRVMVSGNAEEEDEEDEEGDDQSYQGVEGEGEEGGETESDDGYDDDE